MEDKSIDMERIAEAEVIDTRPAFDIWVKNQNSGSKMSFYVTAENWLVQVLESTMSDLGLYSDSGRHTYYRNENDKTTNDGTVTIGEFGLKEGSTLYIEQDAWL